MPKIKVCINPGHDKQLDSGAVNQGAGLREADVNDKVAKKVVNLLNADAAYEAEYVQSNELQSICDKANNSQADLFISIHCNAFKDATAHGVETWYCPGSAKGGKLAGNIQDNLLQATGLYNREAKAGNFYVLEKTSMPAVLIEIAFVTNYDEAKLLKNDQWLDKVALAIVDGIKQYSNG
ncbi:MAG TPA: N-acetylmuramoyl-L-alanine amidase [Patescibacteria group bacterium]|nr:N-acetylmuramoyl-L-alanine amidase [Patescibacteria group bacterium]